jgi:hypothetical protein
MKREKEPAAVRELHQIREEMLSEEKRAGGKYWADANRQGKAFARRHGLRYVEKPSSAYVLHDRPGRRR